MQPMLTVLTIQYCWRFFKSVKTNHIFHRLFNLQQTFNICLLLFIFLTNSTAVILPFTAPPQHESIFKKSQKTREHACGPAAAADDANGQRLEARNAGSVMWRRGEKQTVDPGLTPRECVCHINTNTVSLCARTRHSFHCRRPLPSV